MSYKNSTKIQSKALDCCFRPGFKNQNAGNLKKILAAEVEEASVKLLQVNVEFQSSLFWKKIADWPS